VLPFVLDKTSVPMPALILPLFPFCVLTCFRRVRYLCLPSGREQFEAGGREKLLTVRQQSTSSRVGTIGIDIPNQTLTPILSGMLSKRPNYAKSIAKRRSCSSCRLYYIRVATVAYFLKTSFRLAGRPIVKHFCFAHFSNCRLPVPPVRFL
jgi:hypothetical protein